MAKGFRVPECLNVSEFVPHAQSSFARLFSLPVGLLQSYTKYNSMGLHMCFKYVYREVLGVEGPTDTPGGGFFTFISLSAACCQGLQSRCTRLFACKPLFLPSNREIEN